MPDTLRKELGGYLPGDIKSGRGKDGGDDDHDGKPKLHYAVQLALYVDILERLNLSAGRRAFVWDLQGDEVLYDFTTFQGESLWDHVAVRPTEKWDEREIWPSRSRRLRSCPRSIRMRLSKEKKRCSLVSGLTVFACFPSNAQRILQRREKLAKRFSRLRLQHDLAAKDVVGDVQSERPVAFELRFREPLIRRRLVRKRRMRGRVASDTRAFGAMVGRLDIKKDAIFATGLASVRRFVIDGADGMVGNRDARFVANARGLAPHHFCGRPIAERFKTLELNPDAEIDINFSHCVAEILECEIGIFTGVDNDDEATSTAHHLVEAQVFKMAAIGPSENRKIR
jgi:hypothetical protein